MYNFNFKMQTDSPWATQFGSNIEFCNSFAGNFSFNVAIGTSGENTFSLCSKLAIKLTGKIKLDVFVTFFQNLENMLAS